MNEALLAESRPFPRLGCRRAGPSAAPDRGAYSLIELLTVMLILGILVAVAAPRVADSVSYYRLENAAARIRADLELACRQALTTCSPCAVSFNVSSSRYTLASMQSLDHPSEVYEVDLSRHPYSVELTSAQFAGPEDADVQFNAWGMPDSGGQVVVETGGKSKTVVVSAESGLASIQ